MLTGKDWPENNSSSEIEHTLQAASDAHSEALFQYKQDKNKRLTRNGGIFIINTETR